MASVDLPTWQERFAACFRVRHRLLHVFGIPAVLGGVTAVALSGSMRSRAVVLGVIIGAVGMLLAAWYVVSGADRKLVEMLQAEKRDARGKDELAGALAGASAELRALLERVRAKLDSVDAAVDKVTIQGSLAALDNLRDSLGSARHKAVAIASAIAKLQVAKAKTDATRLEAEITRLAGELAETDGSLRDALGASKKSAETELARCRTKIELDKQLNAMLGTIEADVGVVEKGLAGGTIASADAERLRERLAGTLSGCDGVLQQAAR
jgi:hypothetical protein